jgi:hypothetical protein
LAFVQQPYAARRHLEPSYVIWDDGSNYHADSLISGRDFSETDFGQLFNDAHNALPANGGTFYEQGGGHIHIKKSPRHYKYSTTPLITKSYVKVTGEGRSTVLEPSAAVDGLTVQAPPGSGLFAPEIRSLAIYDPNGNGVGKAYFKLDPTTNTQNITHGIIDNIYYWGGPNQVGSTGKLIQQVGQGSGAFNLNGTCSDFVISNIMAGSNFLQYAGSAPNLPMYASDSIMDFQGLFDSTLMNWLIAFHNYSGTNPWLFGHATQRVNSGNEYYNLKFLTDTTTSALSCVSLNNIANNYFEDLFFEIGAVTAGTIMLELNGFSTIEFRARRLRLDNGDIGIQWDAGALGADAFNIGCLIDDISASRMGTVLKSIAGDASTKEFHGGYMLGTTLMSPNPLTGAQFYHVSRGANGSLVTTPEWGWLVTTPAVPAVGLANAVQNLTGVPVVIYQTGMVGTHVIDENSTDTALGLDPATIRLSPLAKVYYATTVPSSWKWFGV